MSPAAAAAAPVTANAPITIASPGGGGDSTGSGGTATATPLEEGGSPGSQDADESTGALQIAPLALTPGIAVDAPATPNAPITILSPGSGGDATGPDGATPPGSETPTAPDDTAPTVPGGDSPPQGSPPGTDDGSGADGGGGDDSSPAGGGPSRGRHGESGENHGSSPTTTRRELGAQAGDLPFTGLVLWLVALIGALSLTIGTRGRQLTAA